MKIVRLTEEFPHEINRGLAPNVYYISREQVRQGHQVWVFAFTKDTPSVEEKEGFVVHRIKKPHLVRWFGGITFAKAIKKAGIKPDIVHGLNCIPFGWLFPIMKRILPAKYVMSVHGSINPLKHDYAKGIKSKLQNLEFSLLCKYLSKKVTRLFPITEQIKEELIEYGVEEDKIKVISPGIDLSIFKKADDKFTKENKKLRLLYVGRFSQMKNLGSLINACDLLKKDKIKFTLGLIGGRESDDDYQNIIGLIKKYKLENNIILHPPTNQKELVRFYQNSDIFILPSKYEPFGKVILEAMACGLPVIATEAGGTQYTIQNNHTGILCPVNDSDCLSKKIIFLFENKELSRRLSKNATEIMNNYSWDSIASKYIKAFDENN